ncbi:MAG: NAD-dependent epimerase/dehydratase family protein [Halobacteriota archaeon]
MELSGRRVLVTGGAGFVGARLVERLAEDCDVVVVDDLRNGDAGGLPSDVDLRVGDVLDDGFRRSLDWEDVDVVFHLAADPDVRSSVERPGADLRVNALATQAVLEDATEADVDGFVFTSSSTVYGGAPTPTSESHGPLAPESPYGASKLASEGLCTAYSATSDVDVRVMRLANVVGERGHGVVPDFVDKLERDPSRLEVLGDGRQEKSYVHVDDCVSGILTAVESGCRTFYNVGSRDSISVSRIASLVCREMDVDPEVEYAGGRRGWPGDVPRMRLDVGRLLELGWRPSVDSEGAVVRAVRSLV